MTTLPPYPIKPFPEDSLEKQVYNIVENYKENIPVTNDRYRLGYNLVKFMQGQGDEPLVSIQTSKLKLVGISENDLAKRISNDLKNIKK